MKEDAVAERSAAPGQRANGGERSRHMQLQQRQRQRHLTHSDVHTLHLFTSAAPAALQSGLATVRPPQAAGGAEHWSVEGKINTSSLQTEYFTKLSHSYNNSVGNT